MHAPTGPIDPDYDDVRIFRETAAKGIKRALKSGITKPLLVLEENPIFENSELATLLGALQALYVVSGTICFTDFLLKVKILKKLCF